MKKYILFFLSIFLLSNLVGQTTSNTKFSQQKENQRSINALRIEKGLHDGIKIEWEKVNHAIGYELSLNDSNWKFTKENFFFDEKYNFRSKIMIRSIFADGTKSGVVAAKITGNCEFKVEITSLTPPSCYGGTDGSITLKYEGTGVGSTPVLTYQIDNGAIFNQPIINGIISGGNHMLVAQDLNSNCKDTLFFFMPQPDPININIVIDTASCANNNLGSFTAVASGGTAPYSYYWNTFPGTTTPLLNNVIGGMTRLITITDDKGCKQDKSVTMPIQTGLSVIEKIDSIKCFDAKNGKITLNVQGNVSGLTYVWKKNNAIFGSNTNVISNLEPADYSVTISDNKGCTYSNSFILSNPAPLSILATLKKPSCTSDDGEIFVKAKGGTPNYSYLWNYQNSTSQTISNLGSGTYVVTLTDKNGCSVDSTFDIQGGSNLQATVQSNATKCYYSTDGEIEISVIGGTNLTYKWSDPTGQTSSKAINLAPGNYSVTITDISGCTLVKNATVNKADTIKITLTPTQAKCFNSVTEEISSAVIGGTGNFDYKWNNSNLNVSLLDNLSPGTYTLTVTDSNGCTATEKATISSPSAIKLSNFVVKDVKCFGDNNGELSISASGGVGNFSYLWSDANAQITNKASNLAAGTYSVTVTDANGCEIDKSLTVNSPQQLKNEFFLTSPKCNNGIDGEIFASVSGGTIPFTYSWENLLAKTSTIQNIKSGFYKITITDKNNCEIVDTVTLLNPPKITTQLQQVQKSCAGLNNSAAIIDVQGGVAPFTYLWNDKNSTTSSQLTNIGKGSYTVTITDANKCVISQSITITEHDSIVANLVFVKPTCFDSKNGQVGVSFIAGGAGNGNISAYNYQWNTIPAQFTPALNDLFGGKIYQVSITDNGGCKGIAKIFLPQPKGIEITSSAENIKCFDGKDGKIEISASGENPIVNYKWSHNSQIKTVIATNLIAGDYIVTVEDSKGCTASKTLTLNEPSAISLEKETIKGNRCNGEEKAEIAIEAKGGTPTYKYLWSNGSTSNSIKALIAGDYSVSISDINGCLFKKAIKLKDPDELVLSATSKNTTCYGAKNGSIELEALGGSKPYSFSQNGSVYNGKNKLVSLNAGTYLLFVKDYYGCTAETEVEISEPAKFTVEATPDTSLYYGSSIILTADADNNQGNVTFEWTSPSKDAISCNICDSTTATLKTTMTVFLKATDAKGCIATDATNIQILRSKDVFVPTGFTPNFDNIDDKLIIHGRTGTKILQFRVYDRWGEQLYENSNFDINCMMCGWDGTYKGTVMPSGVYIWTAEVESINGEKNNLKGSTTLIR